MVSPHKKMGKKELFNLGVKLSSKWLADHNLAKPFRIFSNKREANAFCPDFIEDKWFGSHIFVDGISVVAVDVERCVMSHRASWADREHTYPGYKLDFTPYGIVCHEVGHHVDYTLKKSRVLSNTREWKRIVDNEEAVSPYEPNYQEAFAEAFRLFLTNPDLLRVSRSDRWDYFVDRLRLNPPHEMSWKTVLKHAPKILITHTEKWIKDQ